MSTLSELIPSGGTQNNIEFVAQGTLANGQTVALRSDGKVEAISIAAQAIGTAVVFEAAAITLPRCSYNPDQDITLVTYEQNSRIHCVAVKVNGSSMTIGTPIEPFGAFSSFGNDAVTFDSNRNQHVLVALNNNGSNHGFMVIVTASGTSLTATGKATLNSSGATSSFFCAYDPTADRSVVGYRDGGNSGYLTCVAITNSGSSLSVGSKFVYRSNANCYNNEGIYSPVVKKVACSFKDGANGNTIMMYGFTITGTTPSYYAASSNLTAVTAGQYPAAWMSYDSTADRFILGYTATSDEAHYATAVQWSGSSFIAGTAKKVSPSAHGYGYVSLVFDPDANITYYSYRYNTASYQFPLTVSGSTITVGTSVTMPGRADPALAAYDTTNNKVIYGFADGNNSNYGTVQSFTSALSNVSSYIGITNAAISSGATGEVAVKGGLSTTADLGTFTPSFSTPVRYTTSNSAAPACSVCYDTTNDRYVMFYTDSTNSNYGYATVGTYSSGTTTWGTPVAVNSVNSSNVKAVFDASQGKVLFVYTNGSDSSKLVSAVGTVSGTSISVGSAVTMSASLTSTANTSVTYDANVNRSLVLTRVGSDSSKVYASVVSISGTTPTFNGTAVLTGTLATTQNIASCFDPDTNKVAAFVYDANASTTSGYVVTVSASSFSTSAGLNIGIGEALGMLSEYSTVANQVLVFVKPSAVSASQARTFTVAATLSVSSDWVNVVSNSVASTLAIAEDVSKGVIVLAGQDEISGAQGKVSLATISGASLTVTTATVFQASAANPATAVYNPDSSNVLIGYRNGSTYGTSAIVSVASDTLTIGSNYFVQDDGSLATTSSSTKAGKAISTTALNLVDPT